MKALSKTHLLSALLVLASLAVVQAGTGYEVQCPDEKCGFKTNAGIGGGMMFEEAAGYCAACEKWVSVTWKRGEKPPEPVADFWDPKVGQQRKVHRCPNGPHTFVACPRIEDFQHCPKCKKAGLKSTAVIAYD